MHYSIYGHKIHFEKNKKIFFGYESFDNFYSSIIATGRAHPPLPPLIFIGKTATLKP